MLEHNNRKTAKQLAEYITGKALRQYLADKVTKYLGDVPVSVFDGACGSGQLEQFIKMSHLTAVEIQQKSCEAIKHNYPNTDVYHQSFFEFDKRLSVDCVVMNPPFSLKFKDLSSTEQDNIKAQFAFKKSGVVDDIFVLKSFEYAKRFGFYILFCGVAYRKTEQTFRQIIGTQLAECNRISNAFDDTSIDVMFLVLDKQKTSNDYYSEYIDFKTKEQFHTRFDIDTSKWQMASMPVPDRFGDDFDIDALNRQVIEADIAKLDATLAYHHSMAFLTGIDFKAFCQKLSAVIEKWRMV